MGKTSPFDHLRSFALAFPEAYEDHPWGETAIKVRKKVFVFMSNGEGGLSLSLKLTRSLEFALEYPFTAPTGYGLGKAGWVSCRFAPRENPPLDVLEAWIGESYRAIAPKSLAAQLSVV